MAEASTKEVKDMSNTICLTWRYSERQKGGELLKTWEVLKLELAPVGKISLICPHCGVDAEMPIGKTQSPVIAAIALALIFDNPSYRPRKRVLPHTVKCRYCKHVFTEGE